MPLVRVRARARVSHPDFNLYPGDEEDMASELAASLGAAVTILGPAALVAERSAEELEKRDRMVRQTKNRSL